MKVFQLLRNKIYYILLLIVLLFEKCDIGENGCTSKTTFLNQSFQNIQIITFNDSGIISDTIQVLSSNNFITKDGDFPDCPASYFISYDSCLIVYNDTLSIMHGSKTGIPTCLNNNILCLNSFKEIKKKDNVEEYEYTFTEADYEFAKNR